MIRIRIQAGGLVLKSSGRGYAVGRFSSRLAKKRKTERLCHASHFSSLASAILSFAGQVHGTSKKLDERRLASLLLTLVPIMTRRVAVADVLSAVREAVGFTKVALAERSGVSRSTINRAELDGADVLTSSLHRLLSACLVVRW